MLGGVRISCKRGRAANLPRTKSRSPLPRSKIFGRCSGGSAAVECYVSKGSTLSNHGLPGEFKRVVDRGGARAVRSFCGGRFIRVSKGSELYFCEAGWKDSSRALVGIRRSRRWRLGTGGLFHGLGGRTEPQRQFGGSAPWGYRLVFAIFSSWPRKTAAGLSPARGRPASAVMGTEIQGGY